MTLLTSWSVQSPDLSHWQASLSAAGVVTWATIGGQITATPPVYPDQDSPAIVWMPSISNAGVVTLTSGAESGQDRAALVDPNGVTYTARVIAGVAYFIPPAVSVGDLLAVGLFEQETVAMLVRSVEPGQDLAAELTLVDAAPGVHLASSGAIPPFESHITLPRLGQAPVGLPLIDHIASDETVMQRSADGSLVPRLVVSLHFASGAAALPSFLEVQHRLTGSTSPWARQLVPAAAAMEVSVLAVSEGLNYDIRFRALGGLGHTSEWVTVEHVTVIGKTSPPPDVEGLSLNGQQLVWSYSDAPPDLAGFLVRVHVDERTSWGDALPLHDGLVSHTSFLLFRDSGRRTYLVKAIDTSGNESANPATIFVDYGALATQNVAEVIDLKSLGFPGTITDGSLLGGNLVANSDTLFWKSDGLPFWSTDGSLFWSGTYRSMVYVATITPPLAWLGGILLFDPVVQANGWRLDYAQDSGALFWGDGAQPFWSVDGTLFWSGAPSAFVPWQGQLIGYTRQAYQIRLTTNAGSLQGMVSQLQAIFDMPDVEETLLNVALSANGTRLPVTKPFAAILIVSPTVVDDGSAATRIRILDKAATGPLALPVNNDQVPVDAHGDFVLKGY